MRNDIALLLNAAIQVKTTDVTKRRDTATRLNDYKQSLKKWLTRQTVINKILFVENTGYPLDELKQIVQEYNTQNKTVEFISFIAPQEHLFDKGYAELNIVKYGLEHSELIKSCDYFIQASGRIFVSNLDAFVNGLPDNFHIVCQFVNNLSNLDCNLLVQKKDFFLEKIYPFLVARIGRDKHMFYERALSKFVHLAIADDYRWYPFSTEPIVEGVGGTKNEPFPQNRWYSIKGTLFSRLFHSFYRTSYGKNRKHLLDMWDLKPKDEFIK